MICNKQITAAACSCMNADNLMSINRVDRNQFSDELTAMTAFSAAAAAYKIFKFDVYLTNLRSGCSHRAKGVPRKSPTSNRFAIQRGDKNFRALYALRLTRCRFKSMIKRYSVNFARRTKVFLFFIILPFHNALCE